MRVFWLNGGLRLEPESDGDRETVTPVEKAIRVLSTTRIACETTDGTFSSPELQAALGSASNVR